MTRNRSHMGKHEWRETLVVEGFLYPLWGHTSSRTVSLPSRPPVKPDTRGWPWSGNKWGGLDHPKCPHLGSGNMCLAFCNLHLPVFLFVPSVAKEQVRSAPPRTLSAETGVTKGSTVASEGWHISEHSCPNCQHLGVSSECSVKHRMNVATDRLQRVCSGWSLP